MEKTELQAAIRAAFENVPYPGDQNICPPSSRDDGEGVTELLRGKDWRSLPSKLPALCMWWMTPEAAHYYLPAYLLGSIETGLDTALEDTILLLSPIGVNNSSGENGIDYSLSALSPQLLNLLSPTQKQVIGEFFIYMLDDGLKTLCAWGDRALEYEENRDIETIDISDRDRPTLEEIIEEYSESMAKFRVQFARLIEFWSREPLKK